MEPTIIAAIIAAIAAIIAAVIGGLINRRRKQTPKEKQTPDVDRTKAQEFREFINSLEEVNYDRYLKETTEAYMQSKLHPMIIQPKDKAWILKWVESVDDEILAVTNAISSLALKQSYSKGVTQTWITNNSLPLGAGRSVSKLTQSLLQCGILAPSTEYNPPGTHASKDAETNPSFNFGPTLSIVKNYVVLSGIFEED